MRYLRIYNGDNGASRFQDIELEGTLTHIVDGVPLLVSGPFACSEITFVEKRKDVFDWKIHVAPRTQLVIVVSGRVWSPQVMASA